MKLRLARAALEVIRGEAARAYPHEARGAQLVGFWHSHPDHPAQPSATDRVHAWEGLLTVVVAVEKGQPGEVTAWAVPGGGLPFAEVALSLVEAR